ncbi:SKA complex subunit 2 isoform X1 [Nerophis lumbriciformis]|uniref:SKA complex subunit 2 isoform X1 n=2 Tax=Nerophis lumbriciformis TaxID=546530 RepID=UPI002AE0AD0F|nr:spindle and kinetochore-associated protein 2-like isoform X1 [Nerophis lumbriciformis]XP_061819176.1 spindle and kinetochore-associated protein 2-like isoform X1 [Nerophis lumbriciformis]
METIVEKLEVMFSKSEAQLDYIENRLKLELINHTAENGCFSEENPVMMLDRLRAVKAKHKVLFSQMSEIAAAQNECMFSIRNKVNGVMALMQHFQQTGVEVPCLIESVLKLEELSNNRVGETLAKD